MKQLKNYKSEQSTQYSPQVELPTRSFPTLASFFPKRGDEIWTEVDKQIKDRLQEELPEKAVRFTEDALRNEIDRQKERIL
jgi:hypothetical protein